MDTAGTGKWSARTIQRRYGREKRAAGRRTLVGRLGEASGHACGGTGWVVIAAARSSIVSLSCAMTFTDEPSAKWMR